MIIDQLPLLSGDVESTDEIPIERGTTTYKTTHAALVKSAADAAAAAQATANAAQSAAGAAQTAANAAQTTADGKAPTSHASAATTYGVGNASNYGHVKLSDTPDANQNVGAGVAATPAAVQAAIDKATWTLLWTNPNPSADFGSQTVSVDLTAYSFVVIELSQASTSAGTQIYTNIAKVDGLTHMMIGNASGKVTRRIVTVSTTGVSFARGESWETYASLTTTHNDYMIPISIYGI